MIALYIAVFILALIGAMELISAALDLGRKGRMKGHTVAVVPIDGTEGDVELIAEGYHTLLDRAGRGDLLFVDTGAGEEARTCCSILAREHEWIHLCRDSELETAIRRITGLH